MVNFTLCYSYPNLNFTPKMGEADEQIPEKGFKLLINTLGFFKYLFIYLAVLGLHWSMRDL